jgi:hypothetical protein
MLILLGLIAAVFLSLLLVIAALLAAPEAYEDEKGLCIIQKPLPITDRISLKTKSRRPFFSNPEPTGLEPATSAVTGRRSSQLS